MYDRPPSEPGATLLKEIGKLFMEIVFCDFLQLKIYMMLLLQNNIIHFILVTAVDEEGSWHVVNPAPKTMNEKGNNSRTI